MQYVDTRPESHVSGSNFVTVAEFPIWVAFLASITDRAAILTEDPRPFPPFADFDRMVEWDPDGFAPGFLAGR